MIRFPCCSYRIPATLLILASALSITPVNAQTPVRDTVPPAIPDTAVSDSAIPRPGDSAPTTGSADIPRTSHGDMVIVPYGSTPTVRCAILRTCLIQLQAGEQLTSPPALGDSERWIVGLMATGPNGTTPLITVKATECALTTDLVLATNRHLYLVSLHAPPCPIPTDPATLRSTRYLAFTYPQEVAVAQTAQRPACEPAPTTGIVPDQLHFAYHIQKDRRFPWNPTQVFDDGVRTYIRVPERARHGAAPILFLLEDGETRALVNYTVTSNYYITDRVVSRAQLVLAEGGKEHRLTITRQ